MDLKKIAQSDDLFEKEVFKLKRFYKNLSPVRQELLDERLEIVFERNKDTEPCYDTEKYMCDTCGSTDNKEHPVTGYCFYCDTDNWRLID